MIHDMDTMKRRRTTYLDKKSGPGSIRSRVLSPLPQTTMTMLIFYARDSPKPFMNTSSPINLDVGLATQLEPENKYIGAHGRQVEYILHG